MTLFSSYYDATIDFVIDLSRIPPSFLSFLQCENQAKPGSLNPWPIAPTRGGRILVITTYIHTHRDNQTVWFRREEAQGKVHTHGGDMMDDDDDDDDDECITLLPPDCQCY